MTRKSKELIWTTMALAGVGLGAVLASHAKGDDARPLEGPRVKQGQDAERRVPGAKGQALQERRPEGLLRLMEGVNPTPEQRQQIRAILEETAGKSRAFREQHRAELEKLRADMRAAREARDQQKIKQLAEQWRELMKDSPREEAVEKIKAVLTPEQVKVFEENQARLRERMQERVREGEGLRGPDRLSDPQRDKLRNMSPQERQKFMEEHHPRRKPEGQGPRDGQPPRGDKLEL